MDDRHELHQFHNGEFTIRERASGQTMHSLIGPWEEAVTLYAKPSLFADRLRAQLSEGPNADPIRVWDVGMGIGANALAAIESIQAATTPTSRVVIESFESQLGGIQTALGVTEAFPFLSRHRDSVLDLLDRGEWFSPGGAIHWRLHEGDFFEQIASGRFSAPDLIYYDFYTPEVFPAQWDTRAFKALRSHCTGSSLRPTDLFTYTAATPVRVAMLLAGFHVGQGPSTERKTHTTQASTSRARLREPLGEDWYGKFLRSTKRLPFDWDPSPENHDRVTREIRSAL